MTSILSRATTLFCSVIALLVAGAAREGLAQTNNLGSCGVTIITHGYQLPLGGATPSWVTAMANAIRARQGAHVPIVEARYHEAFALGTARDEFRLYSENGSALDFIDLEKTGSAIVVLNWAKVADEVSSIETQQVANVFWRDILGKTQAGRLLCELPLHFIGHSRGASLNAALVYALATNGVIVDQVTTLDPHPVRFGDFPSGDDWIPKTYQNVLFADNYFRDVGVPPQGEPIEGTFKQELNGVVTGAQDGTAHEQVHTYYHGTIDRSVLNIDGVTISPSWYDLTRPRTGTGYAFSRYGGQPRPITGLHEHWNQKSGDGAREFVDLIATSWPNAGFDQSVSLTAPCFVGNKAELSYWFSDRSAQQVVEFFLDSDTNPYNGTGEIIVPEQSRSSRPGGSIGNIVIDWVPKASQVGTRQFIGLRTTHSVNKSIRYDYYLKPVDVLMPQPADPIISEVSPRSLDARPVGQPQTLTIRGSGFTSTSRLWFHDGVNPPYENRVPIFVNANELRYDIAVGPSPGSWTARVFNGHIASNPMTFVVVASAAQMVGLEIVGATSVGENTQAGYVARAEFSDGSNALVNATWALVGTSATINGNSGVLTAAHVDASSAITITANAIWGGITKTAKLAVTILNLGGTGTTTHELFANGSFANAGTGWQLAGAFQADARFTMARSTPGYAYIAQADGAAGNNLAGQLNQRVTIPSDIETARLTYWYRITTEEDVGAANDIMAVRVMNSSGTTVLQIIDTRSNLNANAAYESRSFDLTHFRGQTIWVSFSAATNSSRPTTFRIDDVSLSAVLSTSSPPPGNGVIEVTGGGEVIANGSTATGIGNNTYFNSHWMGESTALFNFRIYNRGNGTLALTGSPVVALEGSQSFTVENQPATDIAPGSYRSFQIRFDPKSVGAHGATVVIRSNDATKPEYRFAITGDGMFRDSSVPSVAISSPTVNATHSVSSATLSLAGKTSDNVGVTAVTWSNNRGGGGLAVGTKSWTIVAAALFSGENVLTIAARDAAGNVGTAQLTVTYTPAEPEITTNVGTLSQIAQQGTGAGSQTFTVRNSGSDTLTYSVAASSTGNWLSVAPASGTSTGETDNVTVSYASASLAAGTYQGTITVSAPGAINSPLSLPVTLRLTTVSPTAPYIARSAAGTGIVNNGKVAAPTPDGGLLIAGEFSGGIAVGSQSLTAAGSTDIFLARMDSAGQLLWLKRLGGANEESIDSCVPHPSGGWVICGTFKGVSPLGTAGLTSAGDRDAFIARLDLDGNVTWAHRAGGTNIDYGRQAAVDGLGNCFLVGSFTTSATFSGATTTVSAAGTRFDTFAAKYSANGTFQWVRSFGGNQYDGVDCATADANGNVYVAGPFEQQAVFGAHTLTVQGVSGSDAYLTKLSSTGDFLWAKRVGEPAGGFSIDTINFVTPAPDGACYFGGSSYGPVSIDGQTLPAQPAQMAFVGKVSASGSVAWLRELAPTGPSSISFAEKAAILPDGGVVVGGRMRGQLVFGGSTIPAEASTNMTTSLYFAKVDATGAPVWAVPATTLGVDDSLRYLGATSDGALEALAQFGGSAVTLPRLGTVNLPSAELSRIILAAPLPASAPTISQVPNLTLAEDVASPLLAVRVADADTPIAALTLSVSSSNATLVPVSAVELGGTGADRTIRITPAPNQSGAATLTVTVSDGALTAQMTFSVTVTPQNDPPQTPMNVSPSVGATPPNLTPTLQSAAFADPENDAHSASQWQILDAGSSVVWDSGEDVQNKISRGVPVGVLDYSGHYRWRVRHRDQPGLWSAFSEPTAFQTVPPPPPEIIRSPSGIAVGEGGSATFLVVAQPAGWVQYQWRRNGVELTGATRASIVLPSVQMAHAGTYSVRVSNTAGGVESAAAELTVLPQGTSATHAVQGGAYGPGRRVEVQAELHVVNPIARVTWQVLLPSGWKYSSDTTAGATRPGVGAVDLLEWTWSDSPPNPLRFSFTLEVPAAQTGLVEIVGLARLAVGSQSLSLLVRPDPLLIFPAVLHDADTDGDSRIGLHELTRVIELYNTRNGTIRTGAYNRQLGTEDGFAVDALRIPGTLGAMERYHSADTRGPAGVTPDGAIDVFELTRVIQLYNARLGTVRTGSYHHESGTEDGFAPGP